jgi:membrane protease YdiL (CAAX protease family)
MNTKPSPQNQGKELPMLEKKEKSGTISSIDRKRIAIFVAIAYGFSIAVGLAIWLGGGLNSSDPNVAARAVVLLNVVMFAPMIAHIATRLITREGWSNTFLRPDLSGGRWRTYLAAWFLPPVAIIVGGAIYYLLFPGHFDPSMTNARGEGLTGSTMQSWAFFLTQLGIAIVWPVPPLSLALFLSLGEEFGWRAYLLPKLMPLGPHKAAIVSGAIWGVWHWPAIFLGFNYGLGYWGAPVVGPLLFVFILSFESAFYAWVTLRSGSVWPAALAHGVHNPSNKLMWLFFCGVPNPLIGPGDQGIVGALGFAVLALLIFFSPRALAQPSPAPVEVAVSENPGAPEKAADQAKLGAAL